MAKHARNGLGVHRERIVFPESKRGSPEPICVTAPKHGHMRDEQMITMMIEFDSMPQSPDQLLHHFRPVQINPNNVTSNTCFT